MKHLFIFLVILGYLKITYGCNHFAHSSDNYRNANSIDYIPIDNMNVIRSELALLSCLYSNAITLQLETKPLGRLACSSLKYIRSKALLAGDYHFHVDQNLTDQPEINIKILEIPNVSYTELV